LGVDTFTVLVDKGYHNGRKLPNAYNNITTIVAHPTPGEAKKVSRNRYLVANLNTMQKMTVYMSPRRNFKTTGRWHKKSRTEQSGYQFKKYRTQPAGKPVKHLCTSRPAGREIDRYAVRR
jgi:hypothetical protein